MKAYYFISCFVLFASAASFSIPEFLPGYGSNSLSVAARSNNKCACEDGKCFTDSRGNVKCVCNPGHALQDEFTCKPCDCGSKGKCLFTLSPESRGAFVYKKKCVCDLGSAEKEGKCIDCYCGENSACEFNGEEKNCYCIEGYSEKDGACTKCDCGFYGTCEFKRGKKQCECDEGFLLLNGLCEECDCGKNADSCRFLTGGYKKCDCKLKYAERYGKCEGCDCGDHGTCSFVDGAKYCQCKEGFEDNGDVCKECDCGENSIGCRHFANGEKTCKCKGGFSDRNGKCEGCDCGDHGTCSFVKGAKYCQCKKGFQDNGILCAECDCGENSIGCHFSNGEKICKCKDGFSDRNGKCEVCDCGPNSKGCSFLKNEKKCECADGYDQKRDTCEVCDCGPNSVGCSFFQTNKRCVCAVDYVQKYDTCEEACGPNRPCKYGICVNDFCNCFAGTSGKFCDVVDECDYFCPDRPDIRCSYDIYRQRPFCECLDGNLTFDSERNECHYPCGGINTCKNGGNCTRTRYDSFCRCLKGTEGDFCENVPECDSVDCGLDADCVYDVTESRAACQCQDRGLSFDTRDRKCKRGCTVDAHCKNGGWCTREGFGAFCECLQGTGGDLCEVVEDCKEGRTQCKDDAYCVFDQQNLKAVCECPDDSKRYDAVDEKCKLTCIEDASCHNGGLCMHRGDHLFCECKAGTSGDLCETIDECEKDPCGASGKTECVYHVTKEAAVCRCKNSHQLFDPVTKTCKACECGKNAVSCHFEDGRKVCACRDGYEAVNGNCQKLKCTQKRCHNGKCQVVGDDEVCSCYEGYELEGDDCKKLNCSKTPCLNGTCVVRHGNIEECVCQAGYTLKDGVCVVGVCRIGTCFGGYCDTIDGELMCVCPKNYSLQGIGCYATVCKKQHCFGGWCVVNEDKEEICTCLDGYILVNDVCKKILCKKPCFGGQCKFVEGKEECICPPGYSIFEGVCRADNGVTR